MTIQMSLVFGTLVLQMSVLVILLSPLPHVLRVRLVRISERLDQSPNFKVGLVFSILLLGMQFVDCLNRLKRYRGPIDDPAFASNYRGNNPPLTHDQLASKFHAQRNLYLTGAVIYLNLAIYIVVQAIKKLVAKESEYRKISSEAKKRTSGFAGEDEEVAKYQELIKKKDQDIATLKKQIEGLQAAYDNLTPSKATQKSD